ncbi:sensor histidine kinase [Sphingomonas crocodyli]|uniref:histidine kinase n=1 Tax=Sphingomonas crocodyli TaxID=1979270 RepID=A0A437M9M7_9SPHN|nr:HAMP domain-containing sensor histidine kinase [Sphingomonas crocodyli]RVT94349.1 HAMP domain-containing histidine kinase [Sphingomonas crocodyli]
MRFDDMLATLLAQPLPTAETRAMMWRQVVDVLAQGRGHQADDPLADAPRALDAYNFLRSVRPEIPTAVRLAAGRGLAGRRTPPELVLMFAEDLPHIAAPLLSHAVLDEREWLAILPRLSPSARNLLRNRRDLGRAVVQALEGFGSSDLLITGPEGEAEEIAPLVADPVVVPVVDEVEDVVERPLAEAAMRRATEAGEHQIRDLLSRIESFRTRAGGQTPPPPPVPIETPRLFDEEHDEDEARIEAFRFETGIDGVICWVEGAPREPLIGETIAVAARQTDHGVDGHAAGAYRSRTPFRDARLTIAGSGAAAGEWRISAVPFFDTRDGRFCGYRGTARRPRADEIAKAVATDVQQGADPLAAESLRHLAHELRTPLNAIIGFSEMIENQVQGPASSSYRARAQDILDQGRKLLAAVDDLSLVAAAREGKGVSENASVDAAAILMRLHSEFEEAASERASALAFRIDPELPPVAADAATVERMMSRLLAATISMAMAGEKVMVDLQRDPRRPNRLLMVIVRPRALSGRNEKMLLDPGYNPDGNWPEAPVLGLGFALRLVRNLAIACGGMLDIDSQRFYLSLPLRRPGVQAGNGSR